MKNYAIKNIPNSVNGRKAIPLLKDTKTMRYDMKGRGHRFGRASYWQALPHELSARFTLYGYPKTRCDDYEKEYWRYNGWKNGKPVIRQMTHDYPCKTLKPREVQK